MAVDPKANLFAGMSPYNAMLNNPVFFSDPDGECPVCVVMIIGAVVGGISAGIAAENNGGNFWDGAWKGALIGAVSSFAAVGVTAAVAGAGISAVASGTASVSFGATLAGGAAGGMVSGGLNAYAYGGNIGRGMWQGALDGMIGGMIPTQNVPGIVPGAVVGAAGGAVGGGVAGGVMGVINRGSFATGFIEGAKNGAIGGALSGAVYGGIAVKKSEYERNLLLGSLKKGARKEALLDLWIAYEMEKSGAERIKFEKLENAYGVTEAIDAKTGETYTSLDKSFIADAKYRNVTKFSSEVTFDISKLYSLKKLIANFFHERAHVIDLKAGKIVEFIEFTDVFIVPKLRTDHFNDAVMARLEISAHQAVFKMGISKSYNLRRIRENVNKYFEFD